MLAGRRANRVGDSILKEIAILLLEKIKDPRVRGVTLTGIKLSNDLKSARVFFSVIGGTEAIQEAEEGLGSARGFIRREIGRRMPLKYLPEIRFIHDPTLAKAQELERLFDSLRSEQGNDSDEEE